MGVTARLILLSDCKCKPRKPDEVVGWWNLHLSGGRSAQHVLFTPRNLPLITSKKYVKGKKFDEEAEHSLEGLRYLKRQGWNRCLALRERLHISL